MTVVSETTKAPGSSSAGQVREITVAHSPDSDDAFMFYGLATNKVRTPGLRFTPYALRYRNAEPEGARRRL